MNFSINENQAMIAQMVRDFAEKEIKPFYKQWDTDEYFPVETMKKMGELGLLGIFIPEEYGGSGFSYFEYATALMELGKVCGGIGLSVAAHNSLCTGHIYYHGNEEQKKKYLPKLASGEFIGAWGLTEANTGSDAMRMQTTAVKDGNDWIINGAKNWITHGLSGDVAVILVRTGELLDSNGITAFIIEKGMPGFSAVKIKDKLGELYLRQKYSSNPMKWIPLTRDGNSIPSKRGDFKITKASYSIESKVDIILITDENLIQSVEFTWIINSKTGEFLGQTFHRLASQ